MLSRVQLFSGVDKQNGGHSRDAGGMAKRAGVVLRFGVDFTFQKLCCLRKL